MDAAPFLEPLEPVRLIEETDARTFATHAVLLDMTPGKSELYDYSDAALLNDTPVPVVGTEGRQIGWATVSQAGNKLVAAIKMDYHCPERLSIQTGEKVYAVSSIERFGPDFPKGMPQPVEAVEVTSICLDPLVRSSDLHLPPVGEDPA